MYSGGGRAARAASPTVTAAIAKWGWINGVPAKYP